MHEHIINTPIKDLPPLVEVIFLESMYFHSLSFRKINKGLLSIGHGKASLLTFFYLERLENLCLLISRILIVFQQRVQVNGL